MRRAAGQDSAPQLRQRYLQLLAAQRFDKEDPCWLQEIAHPQDNPTAARQRAGRPRLKTTRIAGHLRQMTAKSTLPKQPSTPLCCASKARMAHNETTKAPSPSRDRARHARRRLKQLRRTIPDLPADILEQCSLRQLSFAVRRCRGGPTQSLLRCAEKQQHTTAESAGCDSQDLSLFSNLQGSSPAGLLGEE